MQITMAGSQDGLALLQSRVSLHLSRCGPICYKALVILCKQLLSSLQVLGPGLGVSQASGIAHAGKQPLTGQTGQALGELPCKATCNTCHVSHESGSAQHAGVQLPQAAQAAASAATASAQATQGAAAAAAAAPTLAEGWSTVPPAARLLGLGGDAQTLRKHGFLCHWRKL